MYDIVLPRVECVASSENYGVFHIEPLEPGFGTTLGNSLRRVLLSSLPGVAIDSVKIDGVYHEFSDIPGVKEDTTELLLNLKQIRLRSSVDQPDPLQLEVNGTGRVTAADLRCPPEVEVVNPEQHLFYVDATDSRINMEFTVVRGKGYQSADAREGLPIGVIPVDAIFSPIRRANFSVQPVRIGVASYERLVLEVWTDGTISPQEAVSQSAQTLVRHLDLLADLAARPVARAERHSATPLPVPPSVYEKPIEELELSVRAYNCLKRAGITKIGQVLEMTEDELLAVRNFGQKSLDELHEKLAVHGYLASSRLGTTPPSERLGLDGIEEDDLDEDFEDSEEEEILEAEEAIGDAEEVEVEPDEPELEEAPLVAVAPSVEDEEPIAAIGATEVERDVDVEEEEGEEPPIGIGAADEIEVEYEPDDEDELERIKLQRVVAPKPKRPKQRVVATSVSLADEDEVAGVAAEETLPEDPYAEYETEFAGEDEEERGRRRAASQRKRERERRRIVRR